jgi:hypothetical protein
LKLFHELLVKLSFEFIEDSSLSFRVIIVGRANAGAPSRLQNPLGCLGQTQRSPIRLELTAAVGRRFHRLTEPQIQGL